MDNSLTGPQETFSTPDGYSINDNHRCLDRCI